MNRNRRVAGFVALAASVVLYVGAAVWLFTAWDRENMVIWVTLSIGIALCVLGVVAAVIGTWLLFRARSVRLVLTIAHVLISVPTLIGTIANIWDFLSASGYNAFGTLFFVLAGNYLLLLAAAVSVGTGVIKAVSLNKQGELGVLPGITAANDTSQESGAGSKGGVSHTKKSLVGGFALSAAAVVLYLGTWSWLWFLRLYVDFASWVCVSVGIFISVLAVTAAIFGTWLLFRSLATRLALVIAYAVLSLPAVVGSTVDLRIDSLEPSLIEAGGVIMSGVSALALPFVLGLLVVTAVAKAVSLMRSTPPGSNTGA